MKFHNLNLSTLIIRFYLMMAVVIIGFFAGIPWLATLAIPIFFSALMGIEFKKQPAHGQRVKQMQTHIKGEPQTSH